MFFEYCSLILPQTKDKEEKKNFSMSTYLHFWVWGILLFCLIGLIFFFGVLFCCLVRFVWGFFTTMYLLVFK